MSSFAAELVVDGHSYPVRTCQFEFTQAMGERGRPSAKVRHGRLHLSLDVPSDAVLTTWAATPYKPLAGHVTFFETDAQTARETVSFEAGQCIGYHESFRAGDQGTGAYVCQLVIVAEKLTLRAGGANRQLAPTAVRDYHTAVAAVAGAVGGAVAAEQAVNRIKQPMPEKFHTSTFDDFVGTVDDFKDTSKEDLAKRSYSLYQEQKWKELEELFTHNKINEYNTIFWPPNRGFVGTAEIRLEKDFVFDRYGGRMKDGEFTDTGTFVAPADVPFSARALPESTKSSPHHVYRVLKPIPGVKVGQAIPWLKQPGMGIQCELPKGGIDALLKGKFIERITPSPIF